MSTVKFVNINKIYDNNVQAVFDFNLEVADKEFIVLVGPSGCGKSTTLRMLAGLEEITSGQIIIDDVVVNDILPKNRDIAMVFQNYALYPHMTVRQNMAFALKMKNLPKEEIEQRVNEAAQVLALEEYLNRKPKELSGGQRQRVALGRAIVRTPKVFLMDEPLSNLDAKLRVQMRSEIIRIHKKVNATTIYVTHDQTEAMTMADRIVVMKDGYIQQIGTPKEVYNYPNNMFVGGFIGSPAMNFLKAKYNNGRLVVGENAELPLTKEEDKKLQEYRTTKLEEMKNILVQIEEKRTEFNEKLEGKLKEKEVAKIKEYLEQLDEMKKNYEQELVSFGANSFDLMVGVRPEDVVKTSNQAIAKVKAEISELLGHELIVYTDIESQKIILKVSAEEEIQSGDEFNIDFKKGKVHFFDVDTTNRIL